MQKHPKISLNKTKIAFKGSPYFYVFQPSSVGSWGYHYKAEGFVSADAKLLKRRSTNLFLHETPCIYYYPSKPSPSLYFTVTTSQSVLPSLVKVRFFQSWQLGWMKNYGLFSKKFKKIRFY